MTTNDKPVCYQIRCLDAHMPGVWGSHDTAESRDALAASWDARGVKYETRDLYARPSAAPQVPEGWCELLAKVPLPPNAITYDMGWELLDELQEIAKRQAATPSAPEQPKPAGDVEADAARYRWLRDQELPDIMDCYHGHPDRFDAAIDARRLAAQPAQGEGEK